MTITNSQEEVEVCKEVYKGFYLGYSYCICSVTEEYYLSSISYYTRVLCPNSDRFVVSLQPKGCIADAIKCATEMIENLKLETAEHRRH